MHLDDYELDQDVLNAINEIGRPIEKISYLELIFWHELEKSVKENNH